MRQSLQIQRDHIKKDLIFIGFSVIENKLKEGTKDTIVELDNADYRMVMANGDNNLTCISVSKECSLVREHQDIFYCEIENNNDGNEILKWKKINTGTSDNLDYAFTFLKRVKNSRFRKKTRKKMQI